MTPASLDRDAILAKWRHQSWVNRRRRIGIAVSEADSEFSRVRRARRSEWTARALALHAQGIKQCEIARIVGVSQSSVSRLVRVHHPTPVRSVVHRNWESDIHWEGDQDESLALSAD